METVKLVITIISGVLSTITLIGVFSKGGRNLIKKLFRKNTAEIQALNLQQSQSIEEIRNLLVGMTTDLDLVKSSSRQQLRNVIKNIYYRYCDQQSIPLYERKTADTVYKLYHEGFQSNSYVSLLYSEICKWKIDPTLGQDFDDDDDEKE